MLSRVVDRPYIRTHFEYSEMTDSETVFICVNGINDSRKGTTGVLAERIKASGHNVCEYIYPPVNGLTARYEKEFLSCQLAANIELLQKNCPPSTRYVFVCHSFGCWLAYASLARLKSIHVHEMIFISPAMNMRTTFEDVRNQFVHLHVLKNPFDIATLIGGFMPCHIFGWAGNFGFPLANGNHTEYNYPSRKKWAWNHNFWFSEKKQALHWVLLKLTDITEMEIR